MTAGRSPPTKFAAEHQVILVTCQRKRREALAELDPELYRSRVRWLEARPVAMA